MDVFFNNERVTTEQDSLLGFLTEQTLHEKKGIAVALNQEVIPRAYWNAQQLQDGDTLLIITATQGG